jgi:riboflavin kinase
LEEKTWIETLMLLAKAGAAKSEIRVSSSWLASRLGGSKQTAIRRLADLESQSMITRRTETRGQVIRISPAGLSSLRAIHKELENILNSRQTSLTLSGRVVTGMGEGSYYVGQPKYAEQFKKELGFTPYPGTLDLKLDKDSLELKETLMRMPSKQVSGFKTSERTFGPVKFLHARLKGTKSAVVLPNRTHHTDILEIIAPRNLRKSIGLKEGDLVNVEVLT